LIPYIKRLGENCSAYGFPFNEKEVVRVLSDRAKTSRKRKKHPREFFEPSADGLRKREPILCGEGHQPFGKVIQSAKEELINKRAFSDAHPRMQLAKRLIESDFKIGRSTLHVAEVLGVTGFHLIRAFFQAFGVTPHKYQVACRVDCASQMFLESNQTMEVISRAAGFGSVSAMHRAFKKVLGASPSTLFPSLAGTNSSTQWNRCVE